MVIDLVGGRVAGILDKLLNSVVLAVIYIFGANLLGAESLKYFILVVPIDDRTKNSKYYWT